MCIVSVESIMEFEAYAFLQYTKGNFLNSVAMAQLKMDYLPQVLKDGIADNSPTCVVVRVAVNLPFLL